MRKFARYLRLGAYLASLRHVDNTINYYTRASGARMSQYIAPYPQSKAMRSSSERAQRDKIVVMIIVMGRPAFLEHFWGTTLSSVVNIIVI